jgi:signal transduction histidine kinase
VLVDQSSVLLVTDDAEFSGLLTARWQTERTTPAFTLMGAEICPSLQPVDYDLAIVGGLREERLLPALAALNSAARPLIFVADNADGVRRVRESYPHILVMRRSQSWLDCLVLLASEALRHSQAVARALRAEQSNALLERHAALGRYMIEMRHNLNNALTSVLGNSELLLLQPALFSPETRLQLETIRTMAVRMHEILQRFSSLDKELTIVQKQQQKAIAVSHAN